MSDGHAANASTATSTAATSSSSSSSPRLLRSTQSGEADDGEWVQMIDRKTNKIYFYNRVTRQSRWTMPSSTPMAPVQDAAAANDENSEAAIAARKLKEQQLIPFWVRKVDTTGKHFYFNKQSKVSTWERPEGFDEIEEDPEEEKDTNIVDNRDEDDVLGEILMDGWKRRTDKKSGKLYFFNPKTQEASWYPPETRSRVRTLEEKKESIHVIAKVLPTSTSSRGSLSIRIMPDSNDTLAKRSLSFQDNENMTSASEKEEEEDEHKDSKTNDDDAEDEGLEFNQETMQEARNLNAELAHKNAEDDIEQPDEFSRVKRVKLDLAKHRKGWINRALRIGKVHEAKVLLSFKKSLIRKAILKSNRDHDKDCIQMFKNIMCYMGDMKSSKKDVEHARKIIRKALETTHAPLRDEMYLQICKQVTNHPNLSHAINGWILMTILLAAVAPSDDMQMWLHDFIAGMREDEFTDQQIKNLADVCLDRLVLISQAGDRKQVPSPREIEKDQKGEPQKVSIYTPDGAELTAEVDSFTKVNTVRLQLLKGLGVYEENYYLFSIFEVNRSGFEKITNEDDRIMDVVGSWFSQLGKTESPFGKEDDSNRMVLRPAIVLDFQNHFVDDEACINLVYLHAVHDLVNEKFPVMIKDCINLAALQLQNACGDCNPEEHTEDWLCLRLGNLVPRSALFDQKKLLTRKNAAVQEASKRVLEKYVSLKGRIPQECRRQFLETVQTWPFYGTYFATAEQSTTYNLPPIIRLGVSAKALVILNHKTSDVLTEVPLDRITSFSCIESNFTFADKESKELPVKFRTPKAQLLMILAMRYQHIEEFKDSHKHVGP